MTEAAPRQLTHSHNDKKEQRNGQFQMKLLL